MTFRVIPCAVLLVVCALTAVHIYFSGGLLMLPYMNGSANSTH